MRKPHLVFVFIEGQDFLEIDGMCVDWGWSLEEKAEEGRRFFAGRAGKGRKEKRREEAELLLLAEAIISSPGKITNSLAANNTPVIRDKARSVGDKTPPGETTMTKHKHR